MSVMVEKTDGQLMDVDLSLSNRFPGIVQRSHPHPTTLNDHPALMQVAAQAHLPPHRFCSFLYELH